MAAEPHATTTGLRRRINAFWRPRASPKARKANLRAMYATLNLVPLKKAITRLQSVLIRRAARHGTPVLHHEVA